MKCEKAWKQQEYINYQSYFSLYSLYMKLAEKQNLAISSRCQITCNELHWQPINSSPADTLTSVTVEQHQACGWTEVKAWVNLRNDRQLQYKWSKSAANYDKMHSLEVLKKWSFRLISLRKICSLTVCFCSSMCQSDAVVPFCCSIFHHFCFPTLSNSLL